MGHPVRSSELARQEQPPQHNTGCWLGASMQAKQQQAWWMLLASPVEKTNLHIYKNQRLEKKQAGKNKRQVRFLNNWNPHENVNLAFTQLGLSTSIYNREGFGVKSSSENKRLDRCRNLSRDQNFTCFVPLQQTSVTQTILISICFFTFFSD